MALGGPFSPVFVLTSAGAVFVPLRAVSGVRVGAGE